MSDKLTAKYQDSHGQSGSVAIANLPNQCPICHHKIDAKNLGGFMDKHRNLEVVFRCPNEDCLGIFIVYYRLNSVRQYQISYMEPKKIIPKEFSDAIKTVSPNFSKIYNQALTAESKKLDQICGSGYRKALEFLIKDYLISKTGNDDEKQAIKEEFLGACIENRITDGNIKAVAKRAVWLGNDETHYTRKWEEKDLNDLKKLIDLSTHWIDAEILTQEIIGDMPDKKV